MSSYNFSWVIQRQLAGAGVSAVFADLIQQHKAVEFLASHKIGAILSLTEKPIEQEVLNRFKIKYMHSPIRDYAAPTIEQTVQCVTFIKQSISNKIPIVVHCWAGHGRTGTILAAFFIDKGWSWEDAIDHIRGLREGSIESDEQIEFLKEYWSTRNSISGNK